MGNGQQKQRPGAYEEPKLPGGQLEVRISVYNLNGIGFLGAHHSACVIGGKEYTFGGCDRGTGVFYIQPESATQYTFRERIIMGRTTKAKAEIDRITAELAHSQKWQGQSYDLYSNNCNHFAAQMCHRLIGQRPPAWINKLAQSAADNSIKSNRKKQVERLRDCAVATAWLESGKATDFDMESVVDAFDKEHEGFQAAADTEELTARAAAEKASTAEFFDAVSFREEWNAVDLAQREQAASQAEENFLMHPSQEDETIKARTAISKIRIAHRILKEGASQVDAAAEEADRAQAEAAAASATGFKESVSATTVVPKGASAVVDEEVEL